jgi:NAD(P)-dependent dehydrogenase (short-subunit alcohol dehydrogenase family)
MSRPGPKRVIVTGASGGIGRAIAKSFCDAGALVVNFDRADPAAAAELCGPLLKSLAIDLGDEQAIHDAFEAASRVFDDQAPELLVCCAAVSAAAPLLDIALADFDRLMAINVRATFVVCQEAARRMKAAGSGLIIIITSVAAEQAWAGEAIYCVTKAAQRALVQAMAIELAPFNIMVNAIGPGIVDHPSPNMARSRDQSEVLQHDIDRTPLGRFSRPTEIAEAVFFLSQLTGITGQTLYVDGGFLASGLAYFGAAQSALRPKLPDPLSGGR